MKVERVTEIDGLRALAMTLVIASHCHLLPFGWMGVWLFYVISGYVITRGFLLRDVAGASVFETYKSFMGRRFIRIVPVYLLYLLLGSIVALAFGKAQYLADFPFLLTFTYNWQRIFYFISVPENIIFGHLWTLSVEEQFYIFYPLLFLLLPRKAYLVCAVVLVAAGPFVRSGFASALTHTDLAPDKYGWAIYASSICQFDAFLAGALLANFEPALRRRPRAANVLAAIAFVAAIAYIATYLDLEGAERARGLKAFDNILFGELFGKSREMFVYVVVDLMAAAVLAYAIVKKTLFTRFLSAAPLASIGRISYGGYLYHGVVVWIFDTQILPASFGAMPIGDRVPWFLAVFAVTLVLAQFSYYYFESRILRWSQRRRETHPSSRTRDELEMKPSTVLAIAESALPRQQLHGLDFIRFSAALLVVMYHLGFRAWASPSYMINEALGATPAFPWWWPVTWFGWIGVQIFFVLSGYVIVYSAEGATPLAFLRSRFLRLVPAMWICATISAVFLLCGAYGPHDQLALEYLKSLVFYPAPPWVSAAYWTLGVEISFYAVIFALLCADGFRHLERVATVLGFVCLFYYSAQYLNLFQDTHIRATQLLLLQHGCYFALGAMMRIVFREGASLLRICVCGVCIVAAFLQIGMAGAAEAPGYGPDMPAAIPFAIWLSVIGLMAWSTTSNSKLTTWLGPHQRTVRHFGLMTYPLYLLHDTVGGGAMVMAYRIGWTPAVSVFAGIAAALAVSHAVVAFAEPWLRQKLRAAFDRACLHLETMTGALSVRFQAKQANAAWFDGAIIRAPSEKVGPL
jgi:peptidoglycan/LPS O-acetylase OafA/YrhL